TANSRKEPQLENVASRGAWEGWFTPPIHCSWHTPCTAACAARPAAPLHHRDRALGGTPMVARIAVRLFVLLAVVFFGLLTVPSHRPVSVIAEAVPAAPPPPPCGERSPVALNPTAG